MSFKDLKPAELRAVIEQFVGDDESKAVKNKADMLALLVDEGVTYEMYEQFKEAEPVDPATLLDETRKPVEKKVRNDDDVLVRMTRQNLTYEIKGKKFTKEHPFAVMPVEEAQEIFDSSEGFRLATPREVSEYYT